MHAYVSRIANFINLQSVSVPYYFWKFHLIEHPNFPFQTACAYQLARCTGFRIRGSLSFCSLLPPRQVPAVVCTDI